jgi:hypothetical protein
MPLNLDEVRARMSHFVPSDVVALVSEVEDLRLRVRALEVANERWSETAWAAADEIEEHWSAHADADGYGPVNLIRALRSKPQNYGYDTEVIVQKATDEERKKALARIHAAIAGATTPDVIAALRALADDFGAEFVRRNHQA